MYLFNGKILRVDLTNNKVKVESWDVSKAKEIIGPLYLAAKILVEEVPKEADPYSPENKLVWATGAMLGTPAPVANKSIIVARSPLTNAWGDAIASTYAGTQLKQAGYDLLVVEGKAEKPVYIWIHDDHVDIKDATKLWGSSTFDAFSTLKKELGDKVSVVAIGPSGEKLVRMACILGDDYRAFGRCGLGAVMGSKNLKAIAVRGTKSIEIADKEKFNELSKKMTSTIINAPARKNFHNYGTSAGVVSFNQMGNLPVRNWTRGYFPNAEKISGQRMAETILVERKACWRCPIGCGRIVEIKSGPYAIPKTAGPEYETIGALGSLCYVDNLEAIAKANYLCNFYGVDTISAGGAIAWAMEAFEKGIISEKDTGGIELRFGNADAMVKMVELICKREGFGAILSEGVKRAAEKIGKGSEEFAIHVKGLELPMHSPYRFKCMGLQYATSNRGACHNRGSPAYVARGMTNPEIGLDKVMDGLKEEGCGVVTKIHQDACTLVDALGYCKFGIFFCKVPLTLLADLYSAALGTKATLEELMKAAERIWLVERAFNIKMGLTAKDDTLPKRFEKEPPPDGAVKGQRVKLDVMLKEYYEARGYDELGRPKKEKLGELGLDFLIPILYGE